MSYETDLEEKKDHRPAHGIFALRLWGAAAGQVIFDEEGDPWLRHEGGAVHLDYSKLKAAFYSDAEVRDGTLDADFGPFRPSDGEAQDEQRRRGVRQHLAQRLTRVIYDDIKSRWA